MTDSIAERLLKRSGSHVGRSLSRASARRTVAGRGTYTDDISLPRTAHSAFVRSPYAHAWIRNVDTEAAAALPGVLLVMTGLNCGSLHRTTGRYPVVFRGDEIRATISDGGGSGLLAGRAGCHDRCRKPGGGRRACELVEIEWEEIPPTVHAETALDPSTPVLIDLGDNLAFTKTIDRGDVDAAFAAADHIWKSRSVRTTYGRWFGAAPSWPTTIRVRDV